jgi:hypothetical protein
MRSLFFAALSMGSLALGGCATPLTVQKNGGDVASIIDVPSSQIKFIGYCQWGDVPPGGKNWGNGGQGLIVLTNDSIFLLKGDLPGATVQRKIKYKEISGVDVKHIIRAYQLQIMHKDVVVVMEITKNKAMIDQAGTERAAQILRERGVPSFEGKKYYRPRIPPPDFIFIPI